MKPSSTGNSSRILVLRVAFAHQNADWLFELSKAATATVRDGPPQSDAWLHEACERVRSALSQGWGAVLVVSHSPSTRSRAAAQLLATGADDVIDGNQVNAAGDLEQSLQSTTRLLDTCARLEADCGLAGGSLAMQRTRKQLARALDLADVPVLILGETGTGKQLAASALHRLDAKRSGAPFHAVDCGSVVDSLFGSELFGHVQGAFTGAQNSRPGAFATAANGILFLDEIGELTPALQAGFLNALQERKYRPVGSDREFGIKCRIVAATNRNLPALVAAGKFRIDLFSRLDGLRVTLPPLRERREDIAALFRQFVNCHNASVVHIDDDVFSYLASVPLSGNVRELEAIARHSALASLPGAHVRLAHLPPYVLQEIRQEQPVAGEDKVSEMVARGMRLDEILFECSGRAVDSVLRIVASTHPSARKTEMIGLAAKRLGVSPRTIYAKLNGGNGAPDASH